MKHFPHHFKAAIVKLIHHLTAGQSATSEGGVDCAVFDEEHRPIWHEAGFSDEEVQTLCVALGCCEQGE